MSEFERISQGKYRWAQERHEIEGFANYCKAYFQKPVRIAEIGCLYGGTLVFLGHELSAYQAYGINMPLEKDWKMYPGENLDSTIQSLNPTFPYELIQGDSQNIETVEKLEKALAGEKLDLLFIDGKHTRGYPRLDYDAYKGFVREGGVIGFHDIRSCPRSWSVQACWNSVKFSGLTAEFCACKGSNGIGLLINK